MNNLEIRTRVLNELISTEESYLRLLAPLANTETRNQVIAYASSHPISDTQKPDALDLSMFRHGLALVDSIYNHHENVLQAFKALESALENENDIDKICLELSDAIDNMVKDHVNFSLFYDQYSKTIATKFHYFSAELGNIILENPDNMQALSSALIAPIQRLPRYVMLFNEITKDKFLNLPGHESLSALSKRVTESTDLANAMKRNIESLLNNHASIFEFEDDSRFRKGIKNILNQVMTRDGVVANQLVAQLDALGLGMTSVGKKFSNKRYYNFSNSEGVVFSIKVNKNTMTFIFADEFNSLSIEQKKEIHQLQHDLVKMLATTMQAPESAHSQALEIMSYVAFQDGFNELETFSDDDNLDHFLVSQKPSQETLLFRDKLAGIIGANKGLSRQGSHIKPADQQPVASSSSQQPPRFAYIR
tara:strand:- start:31284 stop:32546 length:1263 start_codon:yes stop_codon:yes gene_type:complete